LAPVCMSAIGKLLLGCESDQDVERIARKANAEAEDPKNRVHIPDLLEEVRECRVHGWAYSDEFPIPGHGGIAALVPPIPDQPRIGLGLGTHMAHFQKERFALIGALTDACQKLTKKMR